MTKKWGRAVQVQVKGVKICSGCDRAPASSGSFDNEDLGMN